MQQAVATSAARDVDVVPGKNLKDFVTFFINDQMFGVPVLKVQDILTPDRIAPIPLAPSEVRGSINLRGRIVTVVDVWVRLGLEQRLPEKKAAPAAKESRRPEEAGPPPADGSGSADENAHPAQKGSPDEASRPAAQGNGAARPAGAPVDTDAAAGAAEDANGSADAGERPADDKNRPAEGASPPPADGSGPVDKNAQPAQEESPDEASRPAAQGNGAADAGERPADDENRPAGGASPPVDEDTAAAGVYGMCVTVEHENELYTLLVDRVGDIFSLSDDLFEDNPSTLDTMWRDFALGVYRLESALMVVLDVGRLLDIKSARD